jgi:hypothetical protein
MENPHEAEQAVLLERIIRNVVRRGNGTPPANERVLIDIVRINATRPCLR